MARKISFDLSSKSIQAAIDELNQYRDDLRRKNNEFARRIAEAGIGTVKDIMDSIPDEESGEYDTELVMDVKGEVCGAAIRLSGNKVLFVEFSAGVRYGTKNYPLPSGAKYGVGTYPGQKNAFSPHGWWYIDEQGEKHHSYGNRAYMPMYHATETVALEARRIAKEVFGG